MNAGDVQWIEFPAGAGRAQAGRRPAIVIQTATATARLPTVLLIPLTTQLDALRFPGTVLLEADATNNLRRSSVALVFQLTAVDKRLVSAPLGRAGDPTMRAIWSEFEAITTHDQ